MPSPSAHNLQQLAAVRLSEAKALLDAGLYAGAWYVAGYAMELALKACICAKLGLSSYPENEARKAFLTHQVADLVLLAGLRDFLQAEQDNDIALAENWSLVETWSPADRYALARSRQEVEMLLNALTDTEHGVIPWLSHQW